MIVLRSVSKTRGRREHKVHVLDDVTATLATDGGNLAILAPYGPDRPALLDLFSGVSQPSSGKITRSSRVSWPLGWKGLPGRHTVEEFLNFLAKIYRVESRAMLRYVLECSGIGGKLFGPMPRLNMLEKTRVMLAAAYALDFDIYLLDGSVPKVGPVYQQRYNLIWHEKLRERRVIATFANPQATGTHFDRATMLYKGNLSSITSLESAKISFESTMRANSPAAVS